MPETCKRRATDRRTSKPRLALADQLLEAGLNASGMPAVLFSPEDEIAYISDAYRELLEVPDHVETFTQLVHHWCDNECGPQMTTSAEDWLREASLERRRMRHRIYEICLTNGRWFLVNETVIAGSWVWNFLTEVTAFKATEQELAMSRDLARQDAETDALTGIFNRRAALKTLDLEMRKAKKNGTSLSLALIDLDHFKSINDTNGHDAGDEVLSHFAVTTSWLLRRTDMFARFGGEEFILIMPGASLDEAGRVVERIRKEVATNPLLDPAIPYTFSSGIASFDDDSLKTLLRRVDEALYQAKADGRNCSRTA